VTTPGDLRAAIARDLKPVRPLLPPVTRALAIAPLALITVAAVPWLHVFRPDMAALGFWRGWGLSLAEAVAGIAMIALALRESVPGRSLSARALVLAFGIGLSLPAAVLVATASASSWTLGPSPGQALGDGIACFRTSATAEIPAFLLVTLLLARAFPLRPVVAGALYGLGCGLIADAGLRLYCDFTVVEHVLFSHGGAVGFSVVMGAIVATVARR